MILHYFPDKQVRNIVIFQNEMTKEGIYSQTGNEFELLLSVSVDQYLLLHRPKRVVTSSFPHVRGSQFYHQRGSTSTATVVLFQKIYWRPSRCDK